MPSAPVLGDILTEERPLEILFDRDPQHLRDTDGDVDAAGKVGIQLQSVEHHDAENERALIVLRRFDQCIYRRKNTVRDHHFLEIAPYHALQATSDHAAGKDMRCEKFLGKIAVAADRALHQLREKAHEQRVFEEILLGLVPVPVDIDDIAHRLKGIKRNTRRQRDRQKVDPFRYVKCTENAVDVVNGEVGVLDHR